MASVTLENVGLHLPILGADARLLRKTLLRRRTGGDIARDRVFIVKALEDLSFRLEDGDRLGLVGHNGAGKTSLLRVLAGVYAPTSGRVTIEGKIYSLLNPGLGIDLEDSGYENIENVGRILGMSSKEMAAKKDEIAEFTELGDYLYLPVRTYSAGMQLRLSFAVITAINPEILLLDEGLGAGDERFSRKAVDRVNDMVSRANIIVLASHSEQMVREMCNKAILMDRGHLVRFGGLDEVFTAYHELNARTDAEVAADSTSA